MNTLITCTQRLVLTLSLLAIGQIAFAQFVWMDDKGVRQYSDRPPPPSVPRSRIIKSPANAAPLAVIESSPTASPDNAIAAPASATAAGTTASAPVKNTAPLTTAERNADYTKRKMDEAEKEKKAAEAIKLAADRKTNCERTQSYSRSLQDGTRLANTDKNGERSYMSDEQRAQEIRNAQRVLAGCK